MTALPTAFTKVNLDQATDDPKQARSELAGNIDKNNDVRAYLLGLLGQDGTPATGRATLELDAATLAEIITGTETTQRVISPEVLNDAIVALAPTGADEVARQQASINAFNINAGNTMGPLVNGIVDDYADETGIDLVASLNEKYNSGGDYYRATTSGDTTEDSLSTPNGTTADFTYMAREFAINNSTVVSHIRQYSTNSGITHLKIGHEDSTTQFDVLVSQSFSHGGTGWEEFELSTPFVVPAIGTYRVGSHFNGGSKAAQNSNYSYVTGNQGIGNNIAFSSANTRCSILGVKYQGPYDDMTLVSANFPAPYDPAKTDFVVWHKEIDSVVPNTDFTLEGSRDNGVTWTAGTLALLQTLTTGEKNYSAQVDLSAQPAGANVRYRLKTFNAKNQQLHGASMAWS